MMKSKLLDTNINFLCNDTINNPLNDLVYFVKYFKNTVVIFGNTNSYTFTTTDDRLLVPFGRYLTCKNNTIGHQQLLLFQSSCFNHFHLNNIYFNHLF